MCRRQAFQQINVHHNTIQKCPYPAIVYSSVSGLQAGGQRSGSLSLQQQGTWEEIWNRVHQFLYGKRIIHRRRLSGWQHSARFSHDQFRLQYFDDGFPFRHIAVDLIDEQLSGSAADFPDGLRHGGQRRIDEAGSEIIAEPNDRNIFWYIQSFLLDDLQCLDSQWDR